MTDSIIIINKIQTWQNAFLGFSVHCTSILFNQRELLHTMLTRKANVSPFVLSWLTWGRTEQISIVGFRILSFSA